MEKYEISKVLTLTTSHITLETSGWLSDEHGCSLPCYPTEYGFFVFVPGCESYVVPDDLRQVCSLATKLGCNWVQLDCDAGTVEELPQYDW